MNEITPIDSNGNPYPIKVNEDELKKLCHYTNLQPLWWFENLEKRDKVLILPNNTNQPI